MCDACTQAEKNPLSGSYYANCQNCAARSLAHGQDYFYARESDSMTPAYRSRLQEYFGNEWMAYHSKVKDWANRIEAARHAKDAETA